MNRSGGRSFSIIIDVAPAAGAAQDGRQKNTTMEDCCSTSYHKWHYTLLLGAFAVGLWSCGKNNQTAEGQPKAVSTPPKAEASTKKTAVEDKKPKYTFARPATVKGIYLTAWTAGNPAKLEKICKWMKGTELNSVVIDVRDSGDMYFPTGIALADEVEGSRKLAVIKPDQLMSALAKNHLWPIARIACFRDNFVPLKHPDMGVQTPSARPWHDRSGHYWLDPYDKRNWMYMGRTVDYALNVGFPEVQLDYVRFPSEGSSRSQVFPNAKKYSAKPVKHEDVIASFASYIRDKVKKRGEYVSADIFGIISSTQTDQGIGQKLEKLAAPFDVISPMIYPSHFARGEYGIPNPNAAPYQIVMKSLHDFRKRLPQAEVRPWLQDFSLNRVRYGAPQVRAQIKALNDSGYKEFLLWNAGNRYTPKGVRTKAEAEKWEAKMKPQGNAAAMAKDPADRNAAAQTPPDAPPPGSNGKRNGVQ